MDRKKIIIAIILFVFLGLTVFTFANPADEVSQLNDEKVTDTESKPSDKEDSIEDTILNSEEDNDSTGRLTISQSAGNNDVVTDNNVETTPVNPGTNSDSSTDNNASTGNGEEPTNKEDYKELIALVDELVKKVNDALELVELTDAREFSVTKDVINSVAKVTDSSVKKTLEEKLESVLPILNDTKKPVVLVNGEAVKETYNGNVAITVEDETATKTKSIKFNGNNVDSIDELVDGNYEITIIDAAYNETTIKFTYDATAPSATRVEILNKTHYDSNENVTIINKGETLRVMVWFDEDLKDSAKLAIDGDRTVTLRKSSALTNEDKNEYVYYYDYIIRQDLAQGEIKFLVNNYSDDLGNNGNDISSIMNSSYGKVIYDSVAPTFVFENTNGTPVASRTVKLIASESIKEVEGWLEVEGSNGLEWTRTFTSNKKIKNITITDLSGNESDAKTLDVKGVDSSVPTGKVSYSNTNPTNMAVVVTLTTSTDCLTPEGWTKVNWRKFTKVYSENVNEKVRLTSRTGIDSDKDVNVEISNIDKEPATVTYHVYGNQVRIFANEKISLSAAGWTNKNDGKEWRKTLTSGKEYTLVATDLAGNTTDIVIDRILPTATVSYDVTTLTNANVTVTMVTSEEIETPSGWTKVDSTTYTKVYEENVDESITITDLVGNSNTSNVLITNIDKEPAILSYSIHGTHAWIKSNEEIAIPGSTRHEDKNGNVDWRIKLAAGKEYTLVATDLAGNTTDIIIDRVLPEVNSVVFKNIDNKDNPYLATIGDRVWIYLNVSKRLGNKPTFTVNGQSLEVIQYENGDNWNELWEKYVAEYKVTKDTPLGDLKFEISNIYDNVGNKLDKLITENDAPNSVTIYDTTNPEIDFIDNVTMNQNGGYKQTFIELNAKLNIMNLVESVSDNSGVMPSVEFISNFYAARGENKYNVIEGDLDTSKEGRYNIYYTVKDDSGNTTKETVVVFVQDTRPIEVLSVVVTPSNDKKTALVAIHSNKQIKAPSSDWSLSQQGSSLIKKYYRNTDVNGEEIILTDLNGKKYSVNIKVDSIVDDNGNSKISVGSKETLVNIAQAINSGDKSYKGKTIDIVADIDLKGVAWTPINGWSGILNGTIINGNGYTIKNLNTTAENSAGFIGNNASSLTIKNLNFDNAMVKTTATRTAYAGVVMGKNYSKVIIENVKITNSRVENNWQAGGFVGFAEGNAPVFKKCSISNSYVGGKNASAGTIFGLGIVDVTMENCTATNVQLYTDGLTWNSTQKQLGNYWVGHLYGKTLTVDKSTENNVTVVAE